MITIHINQERPIKHSKQSLTPMTPQSQVENGEEQLVSWLKEYEGRLILICLILIMIGMIIYIVTLNNNIELLKTSPCDLCLQQTNGILNRFTGG